MHLVYTLLRLSDMAGLLHLVDTGVRQAKQASGEDKSQLHSCKHYAGRYGIARYTTIVLMWKMEMKEV